MKKILALTDYKGYFGSRYNAIPKYSGMDQEKLISIFNEYGFELEFQTYSDINFLENSYEDILIIYTSQEDHNSFYKRYIEDLIYGLELSGAKLVPKYKFLKAHNNKVFMEILRNISELNKDRELKSWYFGTLEEAINSHNKFTFPVVIKGSEGAMSSNVYLAKNEKELIKVVKKITLTRNFMFDLREKARILKHKGYIKHSIFRKKFIVQNFIPNLNNDWKILIFDNKYYVFKRSIRENDFRASGSGNKDYLYGSNAQLPEGILEYAKNIYDKLNIPCASLDIAFTNSKFFLLEFQAIYFGTVGQLRSDCYYKYFNNTFDLCNNDLSLEEVYAESILKYIARI